MNRRECTEEVSFRLYEGTSRDSRGTLLSRVLESRARPYPDHGSTGTGPAPETTRRDDAPGKSDWSNLDGPKVTEIDLLGIVHRPDLLEGLKTR